MEDQKQEERPAAVPPRPEPGAARVAAPSGPDQSGEAEESGTEVLGAPGGSGEAFSNRSPEPPSEGTLAIP